MQFFNELINYKPDNLSEYQQLVFWVMVLAIIALWCFIDIIGYLISIYVLKYTDVEKKYPKWKGLINYFLKANYLFIIFEIFYIVVIYIFIIGICISLLLLNSS